MYRYFYIIIIELYKGAPLHSIHYTYVLVYYISKYIGKYAFTKKKKKSEKPQICCY